MDLVVPTSSQVSLNHATSLSLNSQRSTDQTQPKSEDQSPNESESQVQTGSNPQKKSRWRTWKTLAAAPGYVISGAGVVTFIVSGVVVRVLGQVSTNFLPGNSTAAADQSNSTTRSVSIVLLVASAVLAVGTGLQVARHHFCRKKRNVDVELLSISQREIGNELKEVILDDQDQRNSFNLTITALTQTTQAINEQNTTLVHENSLLQHQVQRLQHVLGQIKDRLNDVTLENKNLNSEAENIYDVVVDFSKQQHFFSLTPDEIDKTLGMDIEKLAEQVNSTQMANEQVLEAFAERIQDLQNTINRLKASEIHINEGEDALIEKEQHLDPLEQSLIQAQSALQDRQIEYEKINQALTDTKDEVATTLQKLQEESKQTSSDKNSFHLVIQPLTDLSENLGALSSRVAQDVQSLNALSELSNKVAQDVQSLNVSRDMTKQQDDEISKL